MLEGGLQTAGQGIPQWRGRENMDETYIQGQKSRE